MKRTFTIEGSGILSGFYDVDKIEKREKDEKRKQEAVAKRQQEQAQTCAEIEADLTPHLEADLAAEDANTIRWFKAELDLLRKCADKWDLPSLPASPQLVAIFLTERSEHGTAHLEHLCRAIAAAHKAKALPNPCDDILPRAIVRLCRKEEQKG